MEIQLVPPSPAFADVFFMWRQEPLTRRFNPVKNRSREELREAMAHEPSSLKPLLEGANYRWFALRGGEAVGTVSLSEINLEMGYAEIGYIVGQKYQGQGIGTEMVRLWVEKIFLETPLRRLTAFVAEENAGSLAVLRKLGFVREGLLREHYLIQGHPVNQVAMGVLRTEWPKHP